MKFKLVSWIIYHLVKKHHAFGSIQELKLAEAVASNDILRVKKLLEQGVDPNVRLVGQAYEPLIFLAFSKDLFTLPLEKLGDRPKTSYAIVAKSKCLSLLLQHGAEPNVRDSKGRTVLEIAILWCLIDTVKLLLLNGADPNFRAKNGKTPLMKAAILGIQDARPMQHKLQIMMYLLDSGAEIDAQTPEGKTALMYAVINSRLEVVELLVGSGASLTITDHQGNQAKDMINEFSSPQQQDYLRKILSQPQANIGKYKYQAFIPEGDRLLEPIIDHQNSNNYSFDDIPRKFNKS
jgi:ankyrin repeat protein